jgi:hypothetical protein
LFEFIRQFGSRFHHVGSWTTGCANQSLYVLSHVAWPFVAQLLDKRDQSLFAGMQLRVQRKEHIEITREECRDAMTYRNEISALARNINLVQVAALRSVKEWKILRNDRPLQLDRVTLPGPPSQPREPPISIE